MSATDFTYAKYGLDFDLPSAIHRRAGFAFKMSQFGWLYSPFFDSTLRRAQGRYRNFFSLLALEPGDQKMVPTVDIDLVWHTHQLSPTRYARFSKAETHGRFISPGDADRIRNAMRSQAQQKKKLDLASYLCHNRAPLGRTSDRKEEGSGSFENASCDPGGTCDSQCGESCETGDCSGGCLEN